MTEIFDDGWLPYLENRGDGSEWYVIENAGHWFQVEDPSTVNKHIMDFVTKSNMFWKKKCRF